MGRESIYLRDYYYKNTRSTDLPRGLAAGANRCGQFVGREAKPNHSPPRVQGRVPERAGLLPAGRANGAARRGRAVPAGPGGRRTRARPRARPAPSARPSGIRQLSHLRPDGRAAPGARAPGAPLAPFSPLAPRAAGEAETW